ncbi:hypothetical protein GCM10027615_08630 [Plantactinospora veratri]
MGGPAPGPPIVVRAGVVGLVSGYEPVRGAGFTYTVTAARTWYERPGFPLWPNRDIRMSENR